MRQILVYILLLATPQVIQAQISSENTPQCTELTISSVALNTQTDSVPFDVSVYLNKTFSDQNVSNLLNMILNHYESEGFMSVEISIENFRTYTDVCMVSLDLSVDTGALWIVDEVQFSSLKRVGPDYLRKVISLNDSTLITPQILNDIQLRLQETNFFESVEKPALVDQDGVKSLYVKVEERNPNYIDGVLGYVPNTDQGNQFIGEGRFGLVNAFSDGSRLDVLFQRLTLQNSRLNVDVEQNWFLGLPIGVQGGFTFFQQDTNYQARTLSIGAEYYLSQSSSVYGNYSNQSISSSTTMQLGRTELDGRRGITTLGYKYRNINHPRVPTTGLEFRIEFATAIKQVDPDDFNGQINDRRISQRILTADADVFIPVKQRQILNFSGFIYLNESSYFTEIDLFRFGGARSFRGYTEEQFFASRVGWLNTEYRYLLNRESFLFAFNTLGGYKRPQLITEINDQFKEIDFLYSFGFGLSYLTRAGQLTFSYAISPQDDIANGKVHFGIVTAL